MKPKNSMWDALCLLLFVVPACQDEDAGDSFAGKLFTQEVKSCVQKRLRRWC